MYKRQLERTESEDGIMVLPKLNEKTLNAEEAAKANALFGAIRDAVQEAVSYTHLQMQRRSSTRSAFSCTAMTMSP